MLSFITKYLSSEKIKNKTQLNEGINFLKTNIKIDLTKKENIEKYEKFAGIGLEFTNEQICSYVDKFIKENEAAVKENPK